MRNLPLTLLAAVLFASACSGPPPANTAPPAANSNVAAPSAPAEESAESVKARDEVVASTRKLQETRFWTAKTEFESLPALSGEMRYEAPDRYYIKQGESEAIIIGGESFAKLDGKWTKSPQDLTGLRDAQKNALDEEAVKRIRNIRMTGIEKIDGRDARVYVHRNSDNNRIESTTRMWVDSESGLIVRSVVETTAGSRTSKITTTYDYKTPVKIETPKLGQ